MTWTLLGWIVWAGLAAFALVLWGTKVAHSNGGVRFLAGRTALPLTLAVLLTAGQGFPRLHLLWIGPALYVLSMLLNGKILDLRIQTAPERAALESERTGGPVEAILFAEYQRYGYAPVDEPR